MQKSDGNMLFSASDLTYFAECVHRTWLDRLHLDSPMEKAKDDEQSKLVQDKGYEHEAEFYSRLQAQHAHCVEINTKLELAKRIAATKQAIEEGAEVIYQATLQRGNLIGHADFLLRSGQGTDGQWLYEVADTKLARSTKAKFILQLCFYSDLLSDQIGQMPRHMHVELGSGKRETFLVNDYVYYYRQLLERFLSYVATYPENIPPYPTPCDHCPLCPWRERCEVRRIKDDHLSAVANITRQQIVRLEQAGIKTVAQLGSIGTDAVVPKLPMESLNKLREQASLQVIERETDEQKVIVLPWSEGEVRGFARLPMPDEGDLFFDMEGDPMQEGGLEYLFGLYYFDDGKPLFKPFWAHDREQERVAFSEFMDFVTERQAQYPAMHIYHYANYERHALEKLMSLHGVKESAVDQLFREHRLVDLYKVVREALRISKPSYSIKYVEAFYAEKRSAEVKKATDSIVVYEHWRETQDPALLESIRIYNEDDCRSTWQLRDWLLSLRPEGIPWLSIQEATASGKKPAKGKSDKTIEHEARLEDFHRRLIVHPENPQLDRELASLIDSLLDFYRRSAKPAWWSLFARQGAEFEDLIEDPEVIAGLHSPEMVGGGDRHDVYRYLYPEQDFKIRAGSHVNRLDNLKDVIVIDLDEDRCSIDLEIPLDDNGEPPSTLAVSMGAPVKADAMQSALFAFADSAIVGDARFKAVHDYLLRKLPEINGIAPGQAIVCHGKGGLEQTISAVERMNESYLFIQGPPGTGKTFTGSHLIATLLRDGKRVAVASNSHKAINNLLHAVDKRMREAGANYQGVKKVSTIEQHVESDFIANVASAKVIGEMKPLPQLLAGTAWLLARPDFWEQYDYLFIDEAGQVSLASTIAMSMCARNLILLGDQMQLGQPIQGVHPGRSGESALDYLLDGEATIAPERGVFLSATYRMHPDVCRFISDAIYDSRLESDESTFKQALVLDENAQPALQPTGIKYIPVVHDGCSQRSDEEAQVVRELVANLITQKYRDGDGNIHPFTLQDILVVAPYNMQVNLLKRTLPEGARVGTVDKFQGQEAQVVLVSMTTSSEEYLPRFIEFLYSRNRMNVALSRARCLAVLIASSELTMVNGKSTNQQRLINLLCQISWLGNGKTYKN
ncbi:MAG: TM0106 family RecB-like putative nuclease [Methylophilaceae bacterium]